jgi:hypothetical protein
LDLRHEVAEQIKEKTRQTMSTSLNGSNNGLSSTPPSTSIPIEIDHKSNGKYIKKILIIYPIRKS